MIKITREQLQKEAEQYAQVFIEKNCSYQYEHSPEEKAALEGIREMVKNAFISGWLQSAKHLLEFLQAQ